MYNFFVVYYINCTVNSNYFDWLSNQINYVVNLSASIHIMATISPLDEEYFRKQVVQLFPNENIMDEPVKPKFTRLEIGKPC
jgi:hypothetical protein